ncbi:SLC13 family permease [Xylanimonas sp. McL0601]|uniref:SLC13 family permease n=1 Tax=Xylanimonas sp. McL0601 TaxID=3414739 RepID=UPI003CE8E984
MTPAEVSLLILVVAVGLFVWNRLPVGLVAIFTALSLWATGLLSVEEALGGFGDPVVVFIAALFVVSEGIDSAGVTSWAGQALLNLVGDRPRLLTVTVMVLSAVASALISLNGATAALIPLVVVVAARMGSEAAHLLMPMVFAGSAGSLLVLTGSPINIVVSDASQGAGAGGFGYFSFAIVGLPLLLGTIVIGVLLAPRLVPARNASRPTADLGGYAGTVAEYYELRDGFYRLRVRDGSPLVGLPVAELPGRVPHGVSVMGTQAGLDAPVQVPTSLAVGDRLIVSGSAADVTSFAVDAALAVAMQPVTADGGSLISREMGAVEVVVPPRSPLVGEEVFPGMARGPELVILAVRRLGRDLGPRPTKLADGDSLLLHGSWAAVDALTQDHHVLVVTSPDLVRRQAAPLGTKAATALAVLAGMVVLLALGLVPPAIAGLGAGAAMVLFRVVSVQQAYRSVSWQTVVLIGGMIPLSTAIQQTGAADQMATVLLDVVGVGRPLLLLVVLFGVTAVLGQFVSNTATVLIVLPVVVAAAGEAHVSVQPFLMMLAVAGASSFLTPVATPGNMMILGPGGYRFGDYWRLGLPILIYWLLVTVVVVPLVWPW